LLTDFGQQSQCRRDAERIFPENLGEHDGQVVLVEQKEADCVRMWKLNEAEKYEMWCELRTSGLAKCRFPLFP
jgi:hypothetical protein